MNAPTETSVRIGPPRCATVDCERKPTHYLVLKIPPAGFDMKNAIRGTVGLALCRDHAEAASPKDVLDHNGGEILDRVVRAMGLVLPDRSRAQLEIRRLGDDNWKAFQRAMAQQGGGGRA